MISNEELTLMKSRMLLAADAANKIVGAPDTVRYDEEEYWRVRHALASLESDVTALMAEVDVWRGMFDERVKHFLNGGQSHEGGSGEHGSDAGDDVPRVADGGRQDGSEPLRDAASEAVSVVPAKRTRRGRKPRSINRGNPSGGAGNTGQLDAGAGESAVGGNEGQPD
jgi:hypothetical protein